jgi:hypothetical protein
MVWQIDRWNTLPEGGGLLDQPAGLMSKLQVISNVYSAFKALHSASDIVNFANNNPDMMRIVAIVNEMRNG